MLEAKVCSVVAVVVVASVAFLSVHSETLATAAFGHPVTGAVDVLLLLLVNDDAVFGLASYLVSPKVAAVESAVMNAAAVYADLMV